MTATDLGCPWQSIENYRCFSAPFDWSPCREIRPVTACLSFRALFRCRSPRAANRGCFSRSILCGPWDWS